MKTKPSKFPWRALPFLISAPLVGLLVSAPAFGWTFADWPVASVAAIGALALVGMLITPDDSPEWWM